MHDLVEQSELALGVEGTPAGHQFVEHDPEREDVGAVVDAAAAERLFGSHVGGRPDGRARAGDLGAFAEPGQSEVGQLDAALLVEHHVICDESFSEEDIQGGNIVLVFQTFFIKVFGKPDL